MSTQEPEIVVESKQEDAQPIEVKIPEPPTDKRQINPIAIDRKKKTLVAKDNVELMRMVQMFMQGNSFPASFDTPAKCVTAWNLACSICPEAPQRAISRMMYVNGILGIWGELPKYLAERTGEIRNFELFVIDEDYNEICFANKNLKANPWAAICRIQRGDRKVNEYYFTMDEAYTAGLANKKGPWQTYAKSMLCWRAQGMALKFEFADALMGAEIIEHRTNSDPSNNVIETSGKEVASDFNKMIEREVSI